jgi:hypothetical protein
MTERARYEGWVYLSAARLPNGALRRSAPVLTLLLERLGNKCPGPYWSFRYQRRIRFTPITLERLNALLTDILRTLGFPTARAGSTTERFVDRLRNALHAELKLLSSLMRTHASPHVLRTLASGNPPPRDSGLCVLLCPLPRPKRAPS